MQIGDHTVVIEYPPVHAEEVGDRESEQHAAEQRLERHCDRIGHVRRADLDETDRRKRDPAEPESSSEARLRPAPGDEIANRQAAEEDQREGGHDTADPQDDHQRDHQWCGHAQRALGDRIGQQFRAVAAYPPEQTVGARRKQAAPVRIEHGEQRIEHCHCQYQYADYRNEHWRALTSNARLGGKLCPNPFRTCL